MMRKGRPVSFAKEMAPVLNSRRGPLGPSGVTPAWSPPRTARVKETNAAAPRLLEDPRTALIPMRRKKATNHPPSLLVLMSAVTGRSKNRFAISEEVKSRSCQSNNTKGPSLSSTCGILAWTRKVPNQRRKPNAANQTHSQWYHATSSGVSGWSGVGAVTLPLTQFLESSSNTYANPKACLTAGRW